MQRYSQEIKDQIRFLRKEGLTFNEIQIKLGFRVPKGTMSYLCKDIQLTNEQLYRIQSNLNALLPEKRIKAVAANRKIFLEKLEGYKQSNKDISKFMDARESKLIALAMLYLGEGAKWERSRGPKLASSSSLIINLYLDLVKECYNIDRNVFKARIQHRADQNADELIRYWSKIIGIPVVNFYPCYVDKRTIGKKTLMANYRGVCQVSCAGTFIQLELEQIVDIISTALRGCSSTG